MSNICDNGMSGIWRYDDSGKSLDRYASVVDARKAICHCPLEYLLIIVLIHIKNSWLATFVPQYWLCWYIVDILACWISLISQFSTRASNTHRSRPSPLHRPTVPALIQATVTGMVLATGVGLAVTHGLLRHGRALLELFLGGNSAGDYATPRFSLLLFTRPERQNP